MNNHSKKDNPNFSHRHSRIFNTSPSNCGSRAGKIQFRHSCIESQLSFPAPSNKQPYVKEGLPEFHSSAATESSMPGQLEEQSWKDTTPPPILSIQGFIDMQLLHAEYSASKNRHFCIPRWQMKLMLSARYMKKASMLCGTSVSLSTIHHATLADHSFVTWLLCAVLGGKNYPRYCFLMGASPLAKRERCIRKSAWAIYSGVNFLGTGKS
ncbi:hypothetical protein F5051DRAFT_501425 [Lentinula edodes]|nr:hypothetical protein F5051DRAFT_501425 [Lentinula edodes]